MQRDFVAAAVPDAIVPHHMVEEPLQADRASGMANDPEVQSDRHHARRRFAFPTQHIEAIAQHLEILTCRYDRAADKLGIVRHEAVGTDQVQSIGNTPQ